RGPRAVQAGDRGARAVGDVRRAEGRPHRRRATDRPHEPRRMGRRRGERAGARRRARARPSGRTLVTAPEPSGGYGRRDEARRAIEAVVLAAPEPVEPRFLAELVELPVAAVEELCAELADEYLATERGFVLARVAGGYRLQTHPDLAPYVERFVLEGQQV